MSLSPPATQSSLADWLHYLEQLHPTEIDLGLDRIRAVAQRMNLDKPYIAITVGGTNGKGSTCAMLEAILSAAGYKTGLYSSPHLVRFNERIRLNGQEASDQDIIEQFQRIESARGETTLSYFEFATLAALSLFQDRGVEVVVLEVGLGGRLDAVNIIDADCAIITSVDIDHAEYLGNTREKIGWEKAHISRPGKPLICADPMPPDTLVEYAESIGADVWLFGRDYNYSGDRQQWAYGGRQQRRSSLAYPALRGANQLLNASAALAAIEALRPTLAVPQQAVRIGLANVDLPGRLQILPGTPVVILDVAHNPHAAAGLGQNLDNMGSFPHTHAVVGMFKDKDIAGVLAKLSTRVDRWYCAGLPGPRGLSGEELAAHLQEVLAARGQGAGTDDTATPVEPSPAAAAGRPSVRPVAPPPVAQRSTEVSTFDDPVQAYTEARKRAGEGDRILVFGSFATVGPVLEHLGR